MNIRCPRCKSERDLPRSEPSYTCERCGTRWSIVTCGRCSARFHAEPGTEAWTCKRCGRRNLVDLGPPGETTTPAAVPAGTTAANVTTFSDTTVSPSTQYFYRVKATNAVGDSLPSNVANATTPATPTKPANPSTLVATASAFNKIDLTWEVILQHSGILLIADAIERAGSADRDKVTQALAASTFEGHVMPYGPTKFVNGQNQGAAPVNTQVLDKDIQVIFPAQFASAKPVFPMPA